MTERFEVVFLGTGSPLPSADRCGAGQVVVAGETHVLVDCGWGAARRLVPSGVRPNIIDVALFTHMHTDHMTDVPDFLFQRWTGGATVPLRVYGPDGTQEMINQQAQSFKEFAQSMNLMAEEIGRTFGELDLTKTQAQWEKAVAQAGSMEERMEVFLDSMEQSGAS